MAKRRANGEGSLFKRKSDGLWVGRLPTGRKPDGSTKFQQFYGKTQKEVCEKMDEAKGSIRNNTFVEPNKILLSEWLNTWIDVTMKESIKNTTWISYKVMIDRHIIPEIGGIKLLELQASHLQKLYNDKLKSGRADGKEGGLSAKSVIYIHHILHCALDQAIKEKFLIMNVASVVKLPKNKEKEMKVLDIEGVTRFLDVAKNNRLYNRYYAAYLLELATGMRRGELLGLRWCDININDCTIKIVQQLVKEGSKHVIRDLKTSASKRVIAVPNEIIDVLKDHKKQQIERLKDLGKNDFEIKAHTTNGLVFISEVGGIVQPRNLVRNFKLVLEKAKLENIRFHDLRHTFVMLSLSQGVDIKTLQSDLGHTSIRTTLDRYGHVNEAMKKDAASRRGELLKICVPTEN